MKMDKATYLLKKRESEENQVKFKSESYCFKCFRMSANCLCSKIAPFFTTTRFIILMHPMEAKKEKLGTGRLALACLKNSQMIMGIDFTHENSVNEIINDPNNHCMVLYPGENSLNVSTDSLAPIVNLKDKQLVIFLIDGTWPCAKKMMKLSMNINSLPRISFTANFESQFQIKEQPAKFCLSTIESIHFLLSEFERREYCNLNGVHDNLIEVFKSMVEFQLECVANPPSNSYRSYVKTNFKKVKHRSKKWGTMRVIHR